ncbi:MAG TPA: hypothetical protein V6C86_24945 [Oculatellaceae cyanobacterium]
MAKSIRGSMSDLERVQNAENRAVTKARAKSANSRSHQSNDEDSAIAIV